MEIWLLHCGCCLGVRRGDLSYECYYAPLWLVIEKSGYLNRNAVFDLITTVSRHARHQS